MKDAWDYCVSPLTSCLSYVFEDRHPIFKRVVMAVIYFYSFANAEFRTRILTLTFHSFKRVLSHSQVSGDLIFKRVVMAVIYFFPLQMWNDEPEFWPLLFTPLNGDFLMLSFQVTLSSNEWSWRLFIFFLDKCGISNPNFYPYFSLL